jgi:hypothetical protein
MYDLELVNLADESRLPCSVTLRAIEDWIAGFDTDEDDDGPALIR